MLWLKSRWVFILLCKKNKRHFDKLIYLLHSRTRLREIYGLGPFHSQFNSLLLNPIQCMSCHTLILQITFLWFFVGVFRFHSRMQRQTSCLPALLCSCRNRYKGSLLHLWKCDDGYLFVCRLYRYIVTFNQSECTKGM